MSGIILLLVAGIFVLLLVWFGIRAAATLVDDMDDPPSLKR